jgi:hypothetical protein
MYVGMLVEKIWKYNQSSQAKELVDPARASKESLVGGPKEAKSRWNLIFRTYSFSHATCPFELAKLVLFMPRIA